MMGVAVMPAFAVACVLLVVAGALKLRSPEAARAALSLLGARVPSVAIRALGAAELGLGGFAVLAPAHVTAGAVAFAYGAFCVTVVLLLRADKGADCGCFGAAGGAASWAHVGLNAIACAVAVGAAFARPPGLEWVATRAPLIAATLALGLAAAALAAYAAFTLFAPAWRAYGSGGTP